MVRVQLFPPFQIYASVAQLVEQRTENPRVVGSTPTGGTIRGHSSSGRAPPCQGGGSEFESRCPLQNKAFAGSQKACKLIWRHSQVVRQRTANPRFPGSNPGDASRKGTSFVYKAKDVPFHSLSKRKRLSCCIYIVRMTAEHYMSAVGASIARPVLGSRRTRLDNGIRRCCDSPIISCTADGQDCRPYKVY